MAGTHKIKIEALTRKYIDSTKNSVLRRAQDPHASQSELDKLSKCGEDLNQTYKKYSRSDDFCAEVRETAAKNPNMSITTLLNMANDPDKEVARIVLKRLGPI